MKIRGRSVVWVCYVELVMNSVVLVRGVVLFGNFEINVVGMIFSLIFGKFLACIKKEKKVVEEV